MTTKKGDDFVVGVGLDTSALDKQVNSIFKKLEEQTKRLTAVEGKLAVAKAKNNTLQMQDVGLAKRKLSLAKQIVASEAKGITGLDKVKQMAGGDKLSVAKAELALKGKMFEFDKKAQALEVSNLKNKKASRLEAQAYAEDIRRTRALHTQALAENARFDRNKARAANTTDPLGVSARQKATLGARMGYEANREYSTSLPELAAPISRAKDQIRKLKRELASASSVEQITNIRERFKDLNKEIREAVQAQNRLNREMNEGGVAGAKFSSSLKHMALQFASVYAVIDGAKAAYRIGRDFDAMRAGLLASSDSAKAAGENFKFLVATSKSLGTDVESGVRGFNRLGSAMKGAGFSPDQIKQVYKSAQEASVTYGLTADKSNLAMIALAQMASKGKISSEELTKQFGEHVPIVMEAAEKATGKTAKEVFKMMENGKLMSKDFLVPFAKSLSIIVRKNGALEAATKKLVAQQHRLTNSYKLMVDQIFQSGMSERLGGVFGDLAEGIESATPLVLELASALGIAFKASWDFTSTAIKGVKEVLGLYGDLAKLIMGVGSDSSLVEGFKSIWYAFMSGIYLNLAKMSSIIDKIKEFRASISLGSTPSNLATALPKTTSGGVTTNTTTIGKIEVNSPNADPKAVANEVMDMFGAQVALFQ